MVPVWQPHLLDRLWDNEVWVAARISVLHRVGVCHRLAVFGGWTVLAEIAEIELARGAASGRRHIVVGDKRRDVGEVEAKDSIASCRPERSAWIPTVDGVNYHVHGRRCAMGLLTNCSTKAISL